MTSRTSQYVWLTVALILAGCVHNAQSNIPLAVTCILPPRSGDSLETVTATSSASCLSAGGRVVSDDEGDKKRREIAHALGLDVTGRAEVPPAPPPKTVTPLNGPSLGTRASAEVGEAILWQWDGGFERRIVYTGRSGAAIFLSYREFKDGIAREPFTQNLTFDISRDKEIGVLGARLVIDSATNAEIRYRVVRQFPNPK